MAGTLSSGYRARARFYRERVRESGAATANPQTDSEPAKLRRSETQHAESAGQPDRAKGKKGAGRTTTRARDDEIRRTRQATLAYSSRARAADSSGAHRSGNAPALGWFLYQLGRVELRIAQAKPGSSRLGHRRVVAPARGRESARDRRSHSRAQ